MKPDHIDTAITIKSHVINTDSLATDSNQTALNFDSTKSSDMIVDDNLLQNKIVKFVQPQKAEIPKLMTQHSTDTYLQLGENRSASEIIGVVPKHEDVHILNKGCEYDPMAKAMLLTFMVYVSSIYILRSAPIWADMISQVKKVFSQTA